MFKKNSVVSELLILVTLATALLVFILTGSNIYSFNNDFNEEYQNNARNACLLMNSVIENISEEMNYVTKQMADNEKLRHDLANNDTEAIQEFLLHIHNHHESAENVFIAEVMPNDGFSIKYDARNVSQGLKFANSGDYHENYLAALENKTCTSYPSLSPVTHRTVLLSTTPVQISTDSSKYVMCFANYLDAKIQDVINTFKIGQGGYAFVMRTTDGMMVAHPDTSLNWSLNTSALDLPEEVFKEEMKLQAINYEFKGDSKILLPLVNEHLKVAILASYKKEEINSLLRGVVGRNVIIGLIVIIALSAFILITFNRKFKPLVDSELLLEKVSDGNLNEKLNIPNSNNEIARLSLSLNKTIDVVGQLLRQTILSVKHLKVGSSELSKAAAYISEGANLQAANVEEIATTMEEVNATVEQNTGNSEVNVMLTKKINQKIEVLETTSRKTVEQAKNMNGFIRSIGELADQIKLLSLNAAIEAAQAGEYGKGFSVIANHIRKLAENTQLINKNITEIGNELSTSATGTLDVCKVVIPLLEKNALASDEIHVASKEQRTSMNQISIAINELNKVTQNNTSTAEELSANSEELSQQTEQLSEVVNFFDVSKSTDKKNTALTSTPKEPKSAKNEKKPSNKPKVPSVTGVPINLNQNIELEEYETF